VHETLECVNSVPSLFRFPGSFPFRLLSCGRVASRPNQMKSVFVFPIHQEFHSYEGPALGLADVVNSTNVWMVQCRSCFGLALEAGQRDGIGRQVVGQKLERDLRDCRRGIRRTASRLSS